jgi:hypothetical protein
MKILKHLILYGYHARIKFGPHRVWLARAFESLVKCLKGRTPISLVAVCLTAKQKSGVLSMSTVIEFVIEIYCTVGRVRHDTHEKPVPRGGLVTLSSRAQFVVWLSALTMI